MISSFLYSSKWFFSHVPTGSGYFISPMRIHGSAIESLFSKLKFGAAFFELWKWSGTHPSQNRD